MFHYEIIKRKIKIRTLNNHLLHLNQNIEKYVRSSLFSALPNMYSRFKNFNEIRIICSVQQILIPHLFLSFLYALSDIKFEWTDILNDRRRVTTTTKCTHVVVVLKKSKYFALIYQLTQSNNQPSISSTFLINSIIQFNCTKISHEFSYKYHFSWSIFCTFIARKSKLNA